MNILIPFYSTYGHTTRMAEAVAAGAKRVKGANVKICRVKETLSKTILKKMGADKIHDEMKSFKECEVKDLEKADAIIFGTPTRFGMMAAQMRAFLDATGGLWMKGTLVGKPGAVFTSSATQHGGQESTILNFHTTLLHHGMVIVGLPYSFQGQMRNDEITGGSPYGASTIAGTNGERIPTKNDLEGARYLGKHVAKIAKKLS